MTARKNRTTRLHCDRCGHTTPLTTEAQAAWALRRHSCATNLERQARRQRRINRETAEGPTRTCHHKVANHQHGTYAAFVLDRCRCRPCRCAHRDYNQNLRRSHAYGRFNGYVDAEPARAHVRALMAQGMGLKRIVEVSDVSQGALWKLIYGKRRPDGTRVPSRRITPSLEQRILAVELDLAGGAVVAGVGTARRIQALVACGWSMSKIAERLGILRSNFTPIAAGSRDVTAATANAVVDLYDELWNTTPPQATHWDRAAYTRARRHAARLGWVPPMAWDDDAIDDPAAVPDTGQRVRPNGRPLRLHIEDIEWLLEDEPFATAERLGNRLGVTRDAVQQACRRGDRPDLVDRLARNATLAKAAS